MLSIKLFVFSLLSQLIKTDFECLNGKNPKNLSHKQILIEFSKGPCTPAILIHGILSSKLVVEIDCPILKAENPDLFETCGWTDCKKSYGEFWKSVPKKEYQIWIPGFTSPMNIFSFNEKSNYCWAKFVRQAYDFTKPLDQAILPAKGFTMKVFGNTKETSDHYECGNGAMKDLFDSFIQPPGSKAFKNMFAVLDSMGYVPGLTYQTIPYNFNLPVGSNEVNLVFSDNLKRLNELTGKKVAIVSHSYGSVNTLYQLNKMKTEDKDSLVKVWFNIAGPFLGAIKNLKTITSGNDQLSFLIIKWVYILNLHS